MRPTDEAAATRRVDSLFPMFLETFMNARCFIPVCLVVVAGLSGCGSNPPAVVLSPPPPAAAEITVSLSPTTVLAGQQATLTWNSAHATSCTGSGAWTGKQPTSGSINVMLQQPTSQTYTLHCEGDGASATQSVTLAYDPSAEACAVKPTLSARLGKRSAHRRKLSGTHS